MEWTEVNIYTTREGIEPVSAVLLEAGITGIQVEDDEDLKQHLEETSMCWDYVNEEILNKPKEETKLKIYVSDNPYGEKILLKVKENIQNLKNIEKQIDINLGRLFIETTSNLNDEKWLNKWKEFYKPFNIGDKILIKPIWEDVVNKDNKVIFNINPGHVFGTGLHQTTRLCIENIERYVNNTSNVLDLGCGSGILFIISLLLGAKSAFAVDIDENAVKVSTENANLNNIDPLKYNLTSGDVINDEKLKYKIAEKKYDLILANIIADVICIIAPTVYENLNKNGVFIASGIIKDKLQDVYNSLEENNLEVIKIYVRDEWVCVVSKLKK